MKKKLTALCLIAGLIALMVAGSTLAYFKDTDTAVNVFTMGNVDILLHEDNGLDASDVNYVIDDEYEDWVMDQDFLPSVKIEKNAWVENTGTEEAYVRVYVIYPEDIEPMIEITLGNTTEWALAKNNSGNPVAYSIYTIDGVDCKVICYTYRGDNYDDGKLQPGDATADFITSVKLLEDVECSREVNGNTVTTVYTYVDGGNTYTYTSTDNGFFPVLVAAAAGQTIGVGDNADEALNTMFGEPGSNYSGI